MSPAVKIWGALLLLTMVAAAPEGPLLLPARDVDVMYDVPDGHGMLQQRMRWDVAERKLRVDPPSPGLYMIISYADGRMSVLRPADQTVLQMPSAQMALPGAGGGFTRLQDGTVAGLACTEWRTVDSAGQAAEICVTPDGVLLRARNGAQILLQAHQVAYAAQPAALFRIPDGYRLLPSPATE